MGGTVGSEGGKDRGGCGVAGADEEGAGKPGGGTEGGQAMGAEGEEVGSEGGKDGGGTDEDKEDGKPELFPAAVPLPASVASEGETVRRTQTSMSSRVVFFGSILG